MHLVPIATSREGMTLTQENWRSIGIHTLAYSLEHLLIRPGIERLREMVSFSSYVGWDGVWILDASTLIPDKNGDYVLRSPYDGGRCVVTQKEILSLMHQWNPPVVMLPNDMESYSSLFPAIEKEYRVTNKPAEDGYNGRVYQRGTIDSGNSSAKSIIDISDSKYAEVFAVLDSHCRCPTCRSGFTQAYLHHIFLHVPLLCQRLLIQHNIVASVS